MPQAPTSTWDGTFGLYDGVTFSTTDIPQEVSYRMESAPPDLNHANRFRDIVMLEAIEREELIRRHLEAERRIEESNTFIGYQANPTGELTVDENGFIVLVKPIKAKKRIKKGKRIEYVF